MNVNSIEDIDTGHGNWWGDQSTNDHQDDEVSDVHVDNRIVNKVHKGNSKHNHLPQYENTCHIKQIEESIRRFQQIIFLISLSAITGKHN